MFFPTGTVILDSAGFLQDILIKSAKCRVS